MRVRNNKDIGRRLALLLCVGLLCFMPGTANAADVAAAATSEPEAGAETAATDEHEAVAEGSDDLELVTVETTPPEPQAEKADEDSKPSKTAVWVPGYWRWDRVKRKYTWVPGFWREPPTGLVWHEGQWERTDKGWVWVKGHWGAPKEDAPQVIVKTPPPAKTEVKPPKPSPDHEWVPGYWKWNGTEYAWVSGSWKLAPKPDQVWVKAHYVRRPSGYVYVPGHWDHPRKVRRARAAAPKAHAVPPARRAVRRRVLHPRRR